MNHSIFALVDCNNFYVSCERVFNPKLRNVPVAVLTNNDGLIIARSPEVKSLGINMGIPLFKIQDLIQKHNIQVFSSNYELYGDMSHRVMQTLSQFTSKIEIYSIDEAFLDLVDVHVKDYESYGQNIRKIVMQWTGIPVSVGIAKTKTLAKAANEFAKKNTQTNGVLDLSHSRNSKVNEILMKIPVSDIWGIGRQYSKLLQRHNIKSALDLKRADQKWIRKKMTVTGLRTVLELNGQACLNLDEIQADKKRIASTRSFGNYVESIEEMSEAVSSYVSNACEKLRSQYSLASCITVFLRSNYHRKDH
ncbi:MAG: Y-family DNA polymerase, partial [Patescibacteria group bacterium]|nr:Y-family DNA polymerase [Patescibacteria group bacterium]